MILKENYKDDIIESSSNQYRKYLQIQNDDGTISLLDRTVYRQTGDQFVAQDFNQINHEVNQFHRMISNVETSNVATKNYEVDEYIQFVDTDEEIKFGYVTATISSGQTISSSNFRETTVTEVFEDVTDLVTQIGSIRPMTNNEIDAIWDAVFG